MNVRVSQIFAVLSVCLKTSIRCVRMVYIDNGILYFRDKAGKVKEQLYIVSIIRNVNVARRKYNGKALIYYIILIKS